MPTSNLFVGVASAIAVIFIWSGFIVFSRAGMATSLTAYDIAALRFMVAACLVLPFLKSWWPRNLSVGAQASIALFGPGAIYSILMYLGLGQASAAYGGVFANGSLPLFTALLAYIATRKIPGRFQVIAIVIIICGGALVGYRGMMSGGTDVFSGIMLFLGASAVLSVYVFGLHHWNVTPRQALVLVNLPNALIFLPIWYFLLPSGLAEADTSTILFQAVYQGLGPGFLAVILFTLAAVNLGATPTAGFSASVPAMAALMAIPVLSEIPTTLEWVGIAIVTAGLVLLVVKRD